ncbi:hypothetical protein BH09ACT7_BH09ACT7_44980 [soil metagenome]
MSTRRRIAPLLASTSLVVFSVAIGAAPSASAEPCEGAAAAQPAGANSAELPSPSALSPFNRQTGHKPAGANDQAPLPRLGQLPLAILKALTPRSAAVQQQAAVAPSPTPGGTAAQQPAPVAQPAPAAAAAPPAPAAPPGTSLVGWVTGPDSPNQTAQRFAITGTDLGIMWDNGDPVNHQVLMAFGDTYGYCGVRGSQWRYNTLFRTQDAALSNTVAVPNGGASPYSGSPVWAQGLSKQIINSINAAPTEKGIIPTAGISVGKSQYLNFMSIKNWDSNGA